MLGTMKSAPFALFIYYDNPGRYIYWIYILPIMYLEIKIWLSVLFQISHLVKGRDDS